MRFDEYVRFDALGLADLIKRGEVSAAELLAVAIERADAVNPRINAIIRRLDERAGVKARERQDPQGPFSGVPFLVKDLLQDMAGEPAAGGSRALRAYKAPETHDVTARWERAGLVVFGMTNTPEFGAKGTTEPLAFGPSRNPWDMSRSTGGSSGGSAAAVAAGIVPMAGANDGGGSIRIPAAACGLFGLKPSRGLIPLGPDHGEPFFGRVTQGVVSRSIRDTAASLDALVGETPYAPYLARTPDTAYVKQLSAPVPRLRIGFSTDSPIGTAVHEDAVRAVRDAAALLEGLGHHVEQASPEVDGQQVAKDWFTAWCCLLANYVQHVQTKTGASWRDFEPDTRSMAAAGMTVGALELMGTLERWHAHTRALARFHERYDFWLSPTVSAAPLRLGTQRTPAWQSHGSDLIHALGLMGMFRKGALFEERFYETLSWTPFTQLANITGRPAMSVPLYWTHEGLPLGVQFVGRLQSEPLMLRLASQLEQARPWHHRLPRL